MPRILWHWVVSLSILQSTATFIEPRWPAPSETAAVVSASLDQRSTELPSTGHGPPHLGMVEDESLVSLVQSAAVCIAAKEDWAGSLGKTLLFHARRTGRGHITVGYFAYWTTERPWGRNRLTRQVLPALMIDAFYSHLFFVLPGLQRVMYGPGDIEGMRVVYTVGHDARLIPVSAFADNEFHTEVELSMLEAVDSQGRFVALTDVWSHQLGARGAVGAVKAGAKLHCYSGDTLVPLTSELAEQFRLGTPSKPRRALPAWREVSPSAPGLSVP